MVVRGKEHPWAVGGQVRAGVSDGPSAAMGAGTRVAVIHAQRIPREGLAALIGAAPGCNVVFAGPALDGVAEAQPVVAVLGLDASPAPLDGQVSALVGAGINVLLIGAWSDVGRIRAGIDAGALGYLTPDASPDVLLEAVDAVSRGLLHVTPDIAMLLTTPDSAPSLSAREVEVVRLFATGMKLSAVARQLGVSPHTAKEYLDRARSKYALAGRPARTRTELYIQAVADGLVPRGEP